MEYQERLAARKREFQGRVLPPLTQTENSSETTLPAPLGWNYFRNYQPASRGCFVNIPLPCEKAIPTALLRKIEY